MGKEITRFHMIIWPAILMALGLPIPKQMYGHGWLLFEGDKMSKSKGNVVDPFLLAHRYGADSIRYYLLREIPLGGDGVYTTEAFLERINTDLCNDLGNLLSRTAAMTEQYFGGKLPPAGKVEEADGELIALAKNACREVAAALPLNAPQALAALFRVVRAANKYIERTEPWNLRKAGDTARLGAVLHNLAQCLYAVGVLLLPFLPDTARRILADLGVTNPPADFKSIDGKFGALKAGAKITKGAPLYPRLDIAKELSALQSPTENKKETKPMDNKKEVKAADGKKEPAPAVEKAAKPPAAHKEPPPADGKKEPAPAVEKAAKPPAPADYITIDDFCKVQLRTAKVIAAERVEKADKLLKLTLRLGAETRTVLSGIAPYYTAEELIGKSVVAVTNLAPRTMRGIESRGMILCADDGGKVVLISPERETPDNSVVR